VISLGEGTEYPAGAPASAYLVPAMDFFAFFFPKKKAATIAARSRLPAPAATAIIMFLFLLLFPDSSGFESPFVSALDEEGSPDFDGLLPDPGELSEG
jgi:hypothetical protein